MPVTRRIVAVIVAFAVAFAPAGAAFAVGSAKLVPGAVTSTSASMSDCHKAPAMVQGATQDQSKRGHCPHCDGKIGCSPDTCAVKCFKVLGEMRLPTAFRLATTSHAHSSNPEQPPGWTATPPAPPPRA